MPDQTQTEPVRVRGIVCPPQAMARPSRTPHETQAIRDALADLPPDMSARSKARCLAQRVVAKVVNVDRRSDPFEHALEAARAILEYDPVMILAAFASDDLLKERTKRFEARGGQQVSAEVWRSETQEIAELLESRLARKFRNT